MSAATSTSIYLAGGLLACYNLGPYYLTPYINTIVDFGLFTATELIDFINNYIHTNLIQSFGKTQTELVEFVQGIVNSKSSGGSGSGATVDTNNNKTD